LLRKIKFNGIFKTGGLANQFGMLGFLELLPIYTTILNHACPNLKKLTLHLGTEGQYVNFRFDGDTAKTDEELIGDVMKTLVEGLPGLQRLVLGDYEVSRDVDGEPIWNVVSLTPVEDEWAPLRLWTKVVDDRARVTQLQHSIWDVVPVSREENSKQEAPLEPDQPDQLEKRELLDQVRLFGTVTEVLEVDIGAEDEDIDRKCRKFHSQRNN
jgi:hypothetical protein